MRGVETDDVGTGGERRGIVSAVEVAGPIVERSWFAAPPRVITQYRRARGPHPHRGLRALGVHGVLPEEQVRPQPFEVDVELIVDLAAAAASDRLDDTVDYGAVAEPCATS